MLAVWSLKNTKRDALFSVLSSVQTAELYASQVPFALNILLSQKGQLLFFFFNPKDWLQLSFSCRDMNVASLTCTVWAVQCNLNDTNSSAYSRLGERQALCSALSVRCII